MTKWRRKDRPTFVVEVEMLTQDVYRVVYPNGNASVPVSLKVIEECYEPVPEDEEAKEPT